jgi:hypothetical protein
MSPMAKKWSSMTVAVGIVVLWAAFGTAESRQVLQGVDDFNLPDEPNDTCLVKEPTLEIRGDINPFYLSGDFDGDRALDFAFLVREKTTGKRGVLVCFASRIPGRVRLGAGQPWHGTDDFQIWGAWQVMSRRSAGDRLRKPVSVDGIVLVKKEAASTLAYWTGSQFAWFEWE